MIPRLETTQAPPMGTVTSRPRPVAVEPTHPSTPMGPGCTVTETPIVPAATVTSNDDVTVIEIPSRAQIDYKHVHTQGEGG